MAIDQPSIGGGSPLGPELTSAGTWSKASKQKGALRRQVERSLPQETIGTAERSEVDLKVQGVRPWFGRCAHETLAAREDFRPVRGVRQVPPTQADRPLRIIRSISERRVHDAVCFVRDLVSVVPVALALVAVSYGVRKETYAAVLVV